MNNPLDDNINLRLPIKISHQTLESFLRKNMIGENIKTEDNGKITNYARVLDLSLHKAQDQDYDLTLIIRLTTLTSLLRNKEARLLVNVSIDFSRTEQMLLVRNFNLQVESSNWLLENSLKTLANKLLHRKLKNKMKYDFRPLITEQLKEVNEKLTNSLEAAEGISISGYVGDFKIIEILPGKNLLLAIVEMEAKALLEVTKIKV